MDAAAYSYTKDGFNVAMEEMRKESEDAWAWLKGIPVETWARHAMDKNCKTNLVVNNISEVFNRMILDIRGKPIKTMLEGVRSKLMVKFNEKRIGGEIARWTITPTYSEKLAESKEWARNCKALMAGPDLYQVNSGEKSYAVNLKDWTCGCGKFDMTAIPCNHVVSAIYKSK